MSRRADRYLNELEAAFDAASARDEDIAANDLARSFRHDATLADRLARGGPVELELTDGVVLPVVEVGVDYVGAGADACVIVHLGRAFFRRSETGTPPHWTHSTWLSVSRAWAVERRKVQVTGLERTVIGTLTGAARDFLAIETIQGETLVPHAAVDYLRSCPGG